MRIKSLLLAAIVILVTPVAVGCGMGISPGGATPASFMSYCMAQRMS